MGAVPLVLRIPELEREAGLVHGFSTVTLGSMGLTHAPDREAVMRSRRDFARLMGLEPESLTTAGAVHGVEVVRVDGPIPLIEGVDAMVTGRSGVSLFATFADCLPIVLWDPEHRCAALAHAGWRGTVAGVGPAAVRAMQEQFGSEPGRVLAGIGPGICGRCYEVGEEVASRFDPRFTTAGIGDRMLLDLPAANRSQLEDAGVAAVHVLGVCTKETPELPSHRRSSDGTRFGAIVALK